MVTRSEYRPDSVTAAWAVLLELAHLLGEYRDDIVVEVDFLASEYEGTGRRHRTQKVQDMQPHKTRGCDLAFETSIEEITIQGSLPGGGEDRTSVRVASIVPFLVMKGMALSRLKEKDAWDIYFCLRNYPGGLDALAEEFSPHLSHGLVQEGLRNIANEFASPQHIGPKFVADFDELTDPDERALRQRDAHERVRYLLEKLHIA